MDDSPFLDLRGRVVLALVVASMLAASLAGAWFWPEWARTPGDHRFQEACVELLWYGLLACGLYVVSRRAHVEQSMLWGPTIGVGRLMVFVLWAIPLVALSTATAYALFIPLSYLAPAFVERWVLQNPLTTLLAGGIHWDAANVLLFAAINLAAPVVEEYGFRGLLLSRWSVKWGTAVGIAASSLAFAVWHVDPLGGVVFGYAASVAYLQTGSLWAPIVLHIANNAIAWTMAAVASDSSVAVTLSGFQQQWAYGLAALVVGAPWGIWLFRKHGMMRGKPIPYLVAERRSRIPF